MIIINIKFFDAHADTILKIAKKSKSLKTNDFHLSFDKLSSYNSPIITLAVFNEGNFFADDIIFHINLIKKECEKHSSCAQYGIIPNTNKISVISSIEGLGNTPDVDITHIEIFKNMGVKFISLTWNQDNPVCGGIELNLNGLTNKGKEILGEMRKHRIPLDLSHISDKGFFDCVEHFDYKICATHSNSRTVCNNMRNLTDEQFKIIVSKNGICGINFYPLFLNSTENATLDDIVRHIEYFLSLGGENSLTLGSDFDGIDITPKEIPDCSAIYRLFDRLANLNYSDETIKKIAYKNFFNFLNFEIF